MAERAARPAHHFTPRTGWVNDPLAVTWRHDRYHLFFQHVPAAVTWAPHCEWGHATSADLLTWEEHAVALRPARDEVGCWSGCVVAAGDGAGADLLFYTSVREEDLDLGRVRLARPRHASGAEPWDSWEPGEVVATAPEPAAVAVFRDPVVLRDGATWRMLVGGGLRAVDAGSLGTACVFGFESDDLVQWRSTGVVAARSGDETEPGWTGTAWECPQLLRLAEVDVLVVSVWDHGTLHHVAAVPGRYRDGRFTGSGPWQQLTYGVPYAATAFTTRDGRPALLAWLREVADPGAGWAGALGLPLAVGVVGERVVVDLAVEPPGVVTWDPDGSVVLDDAAGAPAVELTADPETVAVVPTAGPGLRLPRGEGPVRVLVDGPVCEVLHNGRYGAVPLRRPR